MKRKPPKNNVRRVVHINKNIRTVTINQINETVQTESLQEHTLYWLLMRMKRATRIISQPFTLQFYDGGKRHQYTPDFMVFFDDGSIEIHEVTVSNRQERVSAQRRQEAMTNYCEDRGWIYKVHTEKTLPGPAEKANLALLFGYEAKSYCDEDIACSILSYVPSALQPVTIGEISDEICQTFGFPPVLFEETLFHLLWHGHLQTDLK